MSAQLPRQPGFLRPMTQESQGIKHLLGNCSGGARCACSASVHPGGAGALLGVLRTLGTCVAHDASFGLLISIQRLGILPGTQRFARKSRSPQAAANPSVLLSGEKQPEVVQLVSQGLTCRLSGFSVDTSRPSTPSACVNAALQVSALLFKNPVDSSASPKQRDMLSISK